MRTLKAAVLLTVMAPMMAQAAPSHELVKLIIGSPIADTTTPPAPAPSTPGAPVPAPVVPAPAAAPAAPTTTATTVAGSATLEQKQAASQGFSISIDLDHMLGTGTFYNPNLYASLVAVLVLAPRYSFKVKDISLAVSALARASYEYTLPDNGNGRRLTPYDTRLTFSAPSLSKGGVTGITITPSISYVIPTSFESFNSTLIGSLSAGLSLSRSLWKFDFNLVGSASRGFHRNQMNAIAAQNKEDEAITASQVGQATVVSRVGEKYSDSFGMNNAWGASVAATVNFRATDELSFSAGYTYIHSWRYTLGKNADGTCDPQTAAHASCAGEADKTLATFSANYQLNDHYGVSLGAGTLQLPRNPGAGGATGGFRFPFWALDNGPTNATSISFTLSAAY